jgi:SsrA-binding protein
MSKKEKKKELISVNQTVADNRRARYDYFLEEKFEAGIQLTGTEVKSLRHGHCSLNEAHAGERQGDIWLYQCTIAPYMQAGTHLQHQASRPRKLLLHKKQIHKLMGSVKQEGYTIIPVRIYFNARGLAKVEIALAKGKKDHDKRDTIKERDWNRQKSRLMRGDKD